MRLSLTALLVLGTGTLAYTQANTKLSNLVSPVAVNQHLLPNTTNTKDLGTSTYSWKDQYLRGYVYLDGTRFVSNYPGTAYFNVFLGSDAGKVVAVLGINNTAVGHNALYKTTSGYANTTVGAFSMYNNTTGHSNTAVGVRALNLNTTGYYNTAVGDSALYNNTSGTFNSATGTFSLYSNSSGTNNTATGYYSLKSNTTGKLNVANGDFSLYNNTGSYNTAVGSASLYSNTTASYNTAIGYAALVSNSTGSYNTAGGYDALYSSTSSFNTAFGYNALAKITTQPNNTAIGYNAGNYAIASTSTSLGYSAGAGIANLVNWTSVGASSTPFQSNQVMLGSPYVTSIGGYVNYSNFSDGRYKRNQQANVPGLDFINLLQPITYTLDIAAINEKLGKKGNEERTAREAIETKSKILYTGFAAQEVEASARKLNYDFSGVDKPQSEEGFYGLRYGDFVVPLVKAVQELSEKDKEIDVLNDRITKLEALVSKLAGGQSNILTDMGSLGQNNPNPVKGTTRISYSVPSGTNRAQLQLTNKLGQLVKSIPVAVSSSGTVDVNTTMLSSGIYNYSLVVDGKIVETKKMVVVHDK